MTLRCIIGQVISTKIDVSTILSRIYKKIRSGFFKNCLLQYFELKFSIIFD